MSRLFVKNIPKSVTEDKLRELFSQKGIVTDVQLKYSKEGLFRHFAFIGFQTVDQANAAVEYFNDSFINANKILVRHCVDLGDKAKERAWSKHTPGSSAYKKAHAKDNLEVEVKDDNTTEKQQKKDKKNKKNTAITEIIEKHNNDPLFIEFMESHAKKGSKALWGNDTATDLASNDNIQTDSSDEEAKPVNEPVIDAAVKNVDIDEENDSGNSSAEDNEKEEKVANKKISDKEYMKTLMKKQVTEETIQTKPRQKMEKQPKTKIELFTVKVHGLAFTTKKKDLKGFFRPLIPYTIRIPAKTKGFAYVGFKTEKEMKQALNKDRGFLLAKQLSVFKYESHNKHLTEESVSTGANNANKWKNQEDALKNEEDISESGRLFVRNLSYSVTEEDLQKLFESYGPVAEVNLPIDRVTRKMKGFGVITFMMPEHAVRAYSELDGTVFSGRMLHLLPGKAKPGDDEVTENLGFKEKKEKKLKQSAGSSHNWNTLFMGQNAVAEAVSEMFDTTKEHVLNDNAAVRLALGETQLVAEMKKFMEESGVSLEAFNKTPGKRSKTIILAKNLPARTTVVEITQMFSKFGMLGRVVLPPSGVTALIEFLEPTEARAAFRKMAYANFKGLPLYLEWAPDNTFLQPNTVWKAKQEEPESSITIVANKEIKNDFEPSAEQDDTEPEENTTLYIKNLNFETREDSIRKHFGHCGRIHSASVATKKDPNNPTERLSMGYGFIQFKHRSSTENCLKTMQLTQLDGKSLELKRSDRTLRTDVHTSRKSVNTTPQTGTKILVRNIPFQAKKSEIDQLFKTFGEIKALRLPQKMSAGADSHRGFGFVDYTNKSDAKEAFNALCQSTHLYGRRLVLEWAAGEEDVEDIRKRTAKHFHTSEIVSSKKAVVDPTTIGLKE